MVCLLKLAHCSCSTTLKNHCPFLSFQLSLPTLGSRFTTKSLFCKCLQLPFPVCPVHPASLGMPHLLPSCEGPLREIPQRTDCCHSKFVIIHFSWVLPSQKSQQSASSSTLSNSDFLPSSLLLSRLFLHHETEASLGLLLTYLCSCLCLLPSFFSLGEKMSPFFGRCFLPLVLWIPSIGGGLVSAPL